MAVVEKLVYVLWRRDGTTEGDFKRELLGETARRLIGLGARRLSANLVDEFVAHARSVRRTRLDPPLSGTLSFWLDAADQREPFEEELARTTSRSAGYLVAESVPLVNLRHAARLGERMPGVNVVSLIERPERLGWQAWLDLWLGEHREVAIETQCTFSYVRNVVVRPLTEGAPPWAGIVEEAFPAEAVTDPMLWYRAEGSEEKLRANLKRMIESVRAFLDIDRVESYPMSEYRLSE